MNHTPGPWELQRDELHYGTLSSIVGGESRKCHIDRALMVEVGGFACLTEQEANARLIAAAPDLLDALDVLKEILLQWHEDLPDHVGDKEPVALAKASKAIAKARGIA
jgi:hypothetical protein